MKSTQSSEKQKDNKTLVQARISTKLVKEVNSLRKQNAWTWQNVLTESLRALALENKKKKASNAS